MADKFLVQSAGTFAEREARTTSTGAADAGRIPALDASGRLAAEMMPVGIGADTATVQASEALAAGDLVNVWSSAGAFRVRKADAGTQGKEAHGFVDAAVANGAQAKVFFEGTNTQVTGLAPGRQYLSATTPGRSTDTAPSGSGQVVQLVGLAVAATALNFNLGTAITLA